MFYTLGQIRITKGRDLINQQKVYGGMGMVYLYLLGNKFCDMSSGVTLHVGAPPHRQRPL